MVDPASIPLSDHKSLEFARDIFLFSFYMRGMSFIDLAYLRKKDLNSCLLYTSSPRLYRVERNALIKNLLELQANGIDVAIFTTTENEQTEYLKNQGLFLSLIHIYKPFRPFVERCNLPLP